MLQFLQGLKTNSDDLKLMAQHFRSIDIRGEGSIPRKEIEPIERAIASQIADVNSQSEAD